MYETLKEKVRALLTTDKNHYCDGKNHTVHKVLSLIEEAEKQATKSKTEYIGQIKNAHDNWIDWTTYTSIEKDEIQALTNDRFRIVQAVTTYTSL